jgi:hypothetical protein
MENMDVQLKTQKETFTNKILMICFFLELRASLSKYIFISNLQSRLGYWNGNVLEGNVMK